MYSLRSLVETPCSAASCRRVSSLKTQPSPAKFSPPSNHSRPPWAADGPGHVVGVGVAHHYDRGRLGSIHHSVLGAEFGQFIGVGHGSPSQAPGKLRPVADEAVHGRQHHGTIGNFVNVARQQCAARPGCPWGPGARQRQFVLSHSPATPCQRQGHNSNARHDDHNCAARVLPLNPRAAADRGVSIHFVARSAATREKTNNGQAGLGAGLSPPGHGQEEHQHGPMEQIQGIGAVPQLDQQPRLRNLSTPTLLPVNPATMMAAADSVGHSAMYPGNCWPTCKMRPQESMPTSPPNPGQCEWCART